MKSSYFRTLIAITLLPLCSLAQNENTNHHQYTCLPHIEFKIESGISQLLIQGDYSLMFDSETNSNLTYVALIDHSGNRKIKPGFFLGAGVSYTLNNRFSFGIIYKVIGKQILKETGSISSIKVIGPNTISTTSSGNYLMVSELSNSTIMMRVATNIFTAKINRSTIVLNCGVSAGYSNIKATTHVPNAQFNLRTYSKSFQAQIKTNSSIANQEVKENNACWSVFSNVSFEFINATNISIGYRFTRLGEITLIKKTPASVNLIQSYLSNNEQNSNTTETLSLATTNSRLKLFSHNFSVSIIF